MKMYQFVMHCGDMNVGLTLSESKVRWDYSLTNTDKDAILNLPVNGTYLGETSTGRPFAVRRLS